MINLQQKSIAFVLKPLLSSVDRKRDLKKTMAVLLRKHEKVTDMSKDADIPTKRNKMTCTKMQTSIARGQKSTQLSYPKLKKMTKFILISWGFIK